MADEHYDLIESEETQENVKPVAMELYDWFAGYDENNNPVFLKPEEVVPVYEPEN